MLRAAIIQFCFICSLWAIPASACDTGPWLVGFGYGSPMPSKNGDNALVGIAETLKMAGPTNGIRIVIYNPGASSASLWKARLSEARTRLVKYGIAASRTDVARVPTRNGVVAGQWIGRTTKMTVEVAKGCGG
jgi:hypothetical protein